MNYNFSARPLTIDPRDVALHYAGWWEKNKTIKGGKPSKEEIFNSIGGNIDSILMQMSFLKLAKTRGQKC